MDVLSRVAACVFGLILVAGCASTRVTTRAEVSR